MSLRFVPSGNMSMSESNTPADAEETDAEYIPKALYILIAWIVIVATGGLLLLLVPDLFRAVADIFL
ncbi:hypothetical protein ACYJ1Y_07840 [Natrialbaceae archaeon A-gly3]